MANKGARIFLDKNHIDKCSNCNEYLSVGPIVLVKNKPVCARCPQGKGSSATFYEKLAEYMFFPCKNDIYGCDAMLIWGRVSQHENICKFDPLICPAMSCEEKFVRKDLVQHFTLKHKELLMINNQFRIPGQKDEDKYINKLFIWKNRPFILKIDFTPPCCFFDILGFNEFAYRNLEYNILIEDEEKQKGVFINGITLSDYGMKHHDALTMIQLDLTVIEKQLGSKKFICTFNIEHIALSKNALNNSLLAELECPICMEYMRPPIFMCSSGHVVCDTCNGKLVVCPTCQIVMNDNRNFALEKFTEHISYPCKYLDEGCSTIGQLSDIRSHEAICSIGATEDTLCHISYLEPCEWRGPSSEQITHIHSKHSNVFIDLSNLIELHLEKIKMMSVFFESNSQIFKLKVSNESTSLRICVKSILNSGKPKQKYRYYIDFEDLNQNNRILNLNKDCISAQANDESFINSLVIDHHLYRPFVKDDSISLRIHIILI
ncbi:unnamed protein product [Phaedon cochleariae]|uniref:RING-type E3 ubiquitin transferase n=1 Tax=Phaedon cochleariae TaxID=80249 RepID=A0A9N9SEX3_PHACE|nr:unnamed protein product [Phaedon cochleariae]